jgi:penicillin-binding protein 2
MSLLQSPLASNNKQSRTVGRGVQSIFMIVFTLLMTTGILGRLVYLQIVQGPTYRERAESNRIRLLHKQPERGNIFDRNGQLLATTRYPHSVYLWPMTHKKKDSWSKVGPRLSEILNVPLDEIEKKLEEAKKDPNHSGLVRIKRDLSLDEITALKEYETELDNVEIHTDAVRYYPHGKEFAHVLGYTRELTPEQLQQKREEGYRLRDVIGPR